MLYFPFSVTTPRKKGVSTWQFDYVKVVFGFNYGDFAIVKLEQSNCGERNSCLSAFLLPLSLRGSHAPVPRH